MKNVIQIGCGLTILVCLVIYLAFSIHRRGVVKNLETTYDHSSALWADIYALSSERLGLMKEVDVTNASCNVEEFRRILDVNGTSRSASEVRELWYLEYDLNSAYLDLKTCSVDSEILSKTTVAELDSNAIVINRLVEEYNSSVKKLNSTYSSFPNYLYAHDRDISKMEFFYFEYERSNEKYRKRKEKTERWIETGEWE